MHIVITQRHIESDGMMIMIATNMRLVSEVYRVTQTEKFTLN